MHTGLVVRAQGYWANGHLLGAYTVLAKHCLVNQARHHPVICSKIPNKHKMASKGCPFLVLFIVRVVVIVGDALAPVQLAESHHLGDR